MSYSKPQTIAENKIAGSFAAGCPDKDRGVQNWCDNCFRPM